MCGAPKVLYEGFLRSFIYCIFYLIILSYYIKFILLSTNRDFLFSESHLSFYYFKFFYLKLVRYEMDSGRPSPRSTLGGGPSQPS